MSGLIDEIKKMIIETLDLEDVAPADIVDGEALFGEGLGLDSIDALELGLALQKKYGFKVDASASDLQEHFFSVSTLANFVTAQRVA
ncbi:MAG: acyl carrier protein [Alphaproteobacteria bacterium]|jgi:acyl carrier protein|nr:acyl carrier protein [Alphaproteobacteria bacterium]MBO6629696.1 acyl carrier protein [Alphaproteobacteria bacterium]MDF1625832.1 phosphopantetheine-binding protein [Parvibaculaceae bacterium]